jgi:hypothetical protein
MRDEWTEVEWSREEKSGSKGSEEKRIGVIARLDRRAMASQ